MLRTRFFKSILLLFVFMVFRAHAEELKPFFYELRKDNRVSYILGTQHAEISVTELPFYVLEKLRRSEVFLGEVDFENFFLKSKKSGESLKAKLSAEAWRAVLIALRGWYTIAELDQMSHGHALRKILELYHFGKPYRGPILDYDLFKIALEQGKQTAFLMTADEHIHAGRNIFSLAELEEVKNYGFESGLALRDFVGQGIEEFKGQTERFRRGEADLFLGLEAEIERDLLVERHEVWLPRILKAVDHHNAFLAVGADHLFGPQSILKALQAQGYKVRPFEGCEGLL